MRSFYRQYSLNTKKSTDFLYEEDLPTDGPDGVRFKIIAYYLPQFHQIPENDEWWGKGFTEWTNVVKALPRYVGHEQPRMPADLGFYDLRHADVLRRQADLAKRGGVYGFCFHNYWFSGRSVLETPLQTLLSNPDIDLPFCLNWANESWTRRWDGSEQDILLEQRYAPGDDMAYAESILPAVRDARYIRVNGRPLIMVYRPAVIPNMPQLVSNWRKFFISAGIGDPYLVMAQTFDDQDPRPYTLDASAGFPPHNGGFGLKNERNMLKLLDKNFAGKAISFRRVMTRMLSNNSPDYLTFPGVCPRWDNEPRKPGRGFSLFGTSASLYGEWLRSAAEQAMKAETADERIVFINAWNEWAEGAYLEPDSHHGYSYLVETRKVLDNINSTSIKSDSHSINWDTSGAKPSRLNVLPNLIWRAKFKIHEMFHRR